MSAVKISIIGRIVIFIVNYNNNYTIRLSLLQNSKFIYTPWGGENLKYISEKTNCKNHLFLLIACIVIINLHVLMITTTILSKEFNDVMIKSN